MNSKRFNRKLGLSRFTRKTKFAHLEARSGFVELDSDTTTAHDTIKDHINTCTRDAIKTTTNTLSECEHTFYIKQLAPRITELNVHNAVSTNHITKAITSFSKQLVDLASTQQQLRQSTETINTRHTSTGDRISTHYFQVDRMEREFKDLTKNLHALDQKFNLVSPGSTNQWVTSFISEFAALIQQHANDPPSPSTGVTHNNYITHRLKAQEDRIKKLDEDHQKLSDSLLALGDTINTTPERVLQETAGDHVPLTTLTAIVTQTQDTTSTLTHRITELHDQERNFQQFTWLVLLYL